MIFSLYINDLCSYLREHWDHGIFITAKIPNNMCLLLADDVANCADTARNLQLQLNCISDFCQLSGMEVNTKKTEIMLFRNGRPLRNF